LTVCGILWYCGRERSTSFIAQLEVFMSLNFSPRILKVLTAAGLYTDEQVLENLDRLEELGLRSTDARRVRAKVAALTAGEGASTAAVARKRGEVELPVLREGDAGGDAPTFGGAELWTVRQVAGFLQLHRRTVANWCGSGRIKAVKIGDDWRITGAEVMRLARGGIE
jgi:excisionase family DNA binding protein